MGKRPKARLGDPSDPPLVMVPCKVEIAMRDALRRRARANDRSISGEIRHLLKECLGSSEAV